MKWLVVDAGAITRVDYSAARVLRELHDDLARAGVVLLVVYSQESLLADLDRHRLTEVIGADRVFATLHEALAALRGHGSRAASPLAARVQP